LTVKFVTWRVLCVAMNVMCIYCTKLTQGATVDKSSVSNNER